tara:strand:+ start:1819 stop:1968 length:150 start_codon:yes stop_codon:yes gene_type:complete
MKNGKPLETIQSPPYQVESLTWYATCTHNIKNIRFINPAPATHERSKGG